MFSSFTIRDFRIYLSGMFISMCGTWIQAVAQSWLVFELSNSSFLLGLVGFVSYSPMLLFSLFSGVLADRVNRRKLLILTQVLFMILAFLMALLTHFNKISVNLILIIGLLQGIILSLDGPVRQAIVFELVGKEKILNAIALNSVAFHSARMLGPALAGIFVAVIHIAGCFYINAVSFLAFIIALLMIRPKYSTNNNINNHFFQDLKGGLKFIKNNQGYLVLIGIVGIVTLFGFSYVILMPVFAKLILHLDVKGYGLLLSASGVGSLLAGLMLASLKRSNIKPKILLFSLYAFALSLIVFSLSKSFIFSITILVFIGFFSLSSLVIINSLIQTMVPNEFRGRVMSLYMLTFAGTMPFGSLLAGALSQSIGVSSTLFIFGLLCFILFLLFSHKILRKELVFA